MSFLSTVKKLSTAEYSQRNAQLFAALKEAKDEDKQNVIRDIIVLNFRLFFKSVMKLEWDSSFSQEELEAITFEVSNDVMWHLVNNWGDERANTTYIAQGVYLQASQVWEREQASKGVKQTHYAHTKGKGLSICSLNSTIDLGDGEVERGDALPSTAKMLGGMPVAVSFEETYFENLDIQIINESIERMDSKTQHIVKAICGFSPRMTFEELGEYYHCSRDTIRRNFLKAMDDIRDELGVYIDSRGICRPR